MTFSVVNLEQDVPKKENQKYDRGIIPDYEITQTFDDFINNIDTQLNYTIELIQKHKNAANNGSYVKQQKLLTTFKMSDMLVLYRV